MPKKPVFRPEKGGRIGLPGRPGTKSFRSLLRNKKILTVPSFEETCLSVQEVLNRISPLAQGWVKTEAPSQIWKPGFKTSDQLQAAVVTESALLKGARHYFEENGFHEVTTPHVTRATGACENIATMFQLDFFAQRSYLVQTGQLYLEVWIPRLKRVWCAGPSFRAEPYVDERHLCEFPLVEMELECNFQQLLSHVEGLVCGMVNQAGKDAEKELEALNLDTEPLRGLRPPFKKISYGEAIELLESRYGLEWGADLKAEHEKYLVELNGNRPLFITHYPEPIKFFNMKNNDEDPRVVNSADLILPYSGEAVGSAEREHRPDRVLEKLRKSSMLRMLEARGGSIQDFDWYLQQLRRESVPHAGCGIGLNRVTQYVLRESDIRRATPFPLNMATLL